MDNLQRIEKVLIFRQEKLLLAVSQHSRGIFFFGGGPKIIHVTYFKLKNHCFDPF